MTTLLEELELDVHRAGVGADFLAPPGSAPKRTRAPFEVRLIDDDPELMEQSYRLRYQVFCVERRFLPCGNYPDQRESDSFDNVSLHVGAVDADDVLVATARVVLPNRAGLPLFQHCTLYPDEATINEPRSVLLEVSRVSMRRQSARHRSDRLESCVAGAGGARVPRPAAIDRRPDPSGPFLTLLKAVIYAAKRAGATHLIAATDAALYRWLLHYGFPCRIVGPEVDYYGLVAPHIMSLAELDRVVLRGQFASLDGFPVSLGSRQWPRSDYGRNNA